MALPVTNWGQNAQQPSIVGEAFIPDQLIAGNLKLVTDSVTVYGNAIFQRGTLMGIGLYQGSAPQASAGKTPATATVTFTTQPVSGDTVTIAGTVCTAVAADPSGNQFLIGTTTAATALNLAALVLGSQDTNLKTLTASAATNVVTLTTNAYGTGANATTLATSNATNISVPANFSGGTANTGTGGISAVTTGAQSKAGLYKVTLTSATVGTVSDPSGSTIGTATLGTPFTSPQINFTAASGGSPAAGDIFAIVLDPAGTQWTISNAAGTDGSQNPIGVLVDTVDCTSGPVIAGVYLQGEFNTNALIFGPGWDADTTKTQLQVRGIYLKTPVTANDPL